MLENERLIKEILVGFANYQTYVQDSCKTGNFDTNKAAEGFVAPLLNTAFGWNLKPFGETNYPGIDLIDNGNKIGVQVSSETSSEKINKTLKTIADHDLRQHIKNLNFFFLKPKQSRYTVKLSCLGVSFDPSKDILDFESLIKALNTCDLEKLKRIAKIVKDFLPHLYQSRVNLLNNSRQELAKNITFLERAVFTQLERHEEPFAMLSAIREVRISLQKSGSKKIYNKVAAHEFSNICNILQDCENRIKDEFPELWKCVDRSCRPTADEQEKWDFWKSLKIMMEIRPKIVASADRIAFELSEIDKELSQ
ncbi:SMEK domain-containing protein [Pseudomonas knackmussii]|uniref:SMEK domain-containing protein n=1 Tax=Pseudomonas knackmussii TaxID=65741 RepID=UPI003F49D635